jgi:putative endonuclease
VLCRNWRAKEGEVDIVAAHGWTLIACEVKTRTSAKFGAPELSMKISQQRRVLRMARTWAEHTRYKYRHLRGDIVAILWERGRTPRINHLKGAF